MVTNNKKAKIIRLIVLAGVAVFIGLVGIILVGIILFWTNAFTALPDVPNWVNTPLLALLSGLLLGIYFKSRTYVSLAFLILCVWSTLLTTATLYPDGRRVTAIINNDYSRFLIFGTAVLLVILEMARIKAIDNIFRKPRNHYSLDEVMAILRAYQRNQPGAIAIIPRQAAIVVLEDALVELKEDEKMYGDTPRGRTGGPVI